MGSCLICNGPLAPKNLKYCSKKCAAIGSIKADIACANPKCGKLFHPPKAHSKYCSAACVNAANKQRHPDDVRAKLKDLQATGMKYAEIGKILGISVNQIVGLCRRDGLPKQRSRLTERKTHQSLGRTRIEDLPPAMRHILRERLLAGSEPLPPMHHISWGAIAL